MVIFTSHIFTGATDNLVPAYGGHVADTPILPFVLTSQEDYI